MRGFRFFKFLFFSALFIGVIVFFSYWSYQVGVFTGEENTLRNEPSYIVNANTSTTDAVDFSIFWQTWNSIEENFIDASEMDYNTMVYGAIRGMVSSLGDPHTSFFDPKENKQFAEELSGKYEGVGMYVGIRDAEVTVISPMKGSPAYEAGLLAGDKIRAVDDISTFGMTIDHAVSLIKGKGGTKVKLTISREDWEETKDFELKRAVITIPTLDFEMIEGDIALIKIYQFNDILTKEFIVAANKILNSNTQKIIIDLRNNPGGYMHQAISVASWFIEKGELIVVQDFGEGKEKEIFNSRGPSRLSDHKIVVLLNKGSASASEILAGALRDQNQVKIVGETSFGKGSVQEPVELFDGSLLKVTISKWLTPSGNLIDEIGIEPDVEVIMEEDHGEDQIKDIQLQKAIEIINGLE